MPGLTPLTDNSPSYLSIAMVQVSSVRMLHINPVQGSDLGNGSPNHPFKTITRACRQAQPGTEICLSPGTYNQASGEEFPLVIPAGVTVVGDTTTRGTDIRIEGSGSHVSPTFGRQRVAVLMQDQAHLKGVTVSNPVEKGTGIWIESVTVKIARCTIRQCGREGIFVTGMANPEITDTLVEQNAISGISLVRNARGELRYNLCRHTGYGIAISDHAAPLLVANHCTDNTVGLAISGSARPVLRDNRVDYNRGDGLVVTGNGCPDLGHAQDPGGNVFCHNEGVDVRNSTTAVLVSAGNQITPPGIRGSVDLIPLTTDPIPPLPPSSPNSSPAPSSLTALPVSPSLSELIPVPTPLPLPLVVTAPRSIRLTDVIGHWAEQFIQAMVGRGLMKPDTDGAFQPDGTVTRAEFAVILAQTFHQPAQRSSSQFSDVPSPFWAVDAIAKADYMGFLAGFPDGTFRPDQPVTRIQVITALVQGLGLTGGTMGGLHRYSDRIQIPSGAGAAVAIATQHRLMVNYPDLEQCRPLIRITRAELAVMLYQSLVATLQAPAIHSPFIVNPDPRSPSFLDIDSHWAADFIRGVTAAGIMSGFADGTFRPNVSMTRAQFALVLAHLLNLPPERPAPAFADVPSTHWAALAIQRAYQAGLISGFGDGNFHPDQPISRVQAILSLVNGLDLPGAELSSLTLYDDKDDIPAFARGAIASATTHHLIVNYPHLQRLNPNWDATRAEVAALVYQAAVYLGRLPTLGAPHIVDVARIRALHQTQRPLSHRVIAIDPGHGGADLGNVSNPGVNGIAEKDVTLAIAQQVAHALSQQPEVRVVLTREVDQPLDADRRVQLATKAQASFFVSIHANSTFPSPTTVNGLETYYYSGSVEGANLATAIHQALVRNVEMEDRGVKPSMAYLLRAASMPAVQVEVGFITGEADAKRLTDPTAQALMGEAIAHGILHYLHQQPQGQGQAVG